jgi:RNA polymerase sigma-70 factor (ECF subfamily)
MDERTLISYIQSRDSRGFTELYDRYSHRILGFLLRLTGNRADAEDLMQEVFLAAFLGSARFRGKSSLLTFLLGIAVRKQRDRARQLRPETVARAEMPLNDEIAAGAAPGDDLANGVVNRLMLHDALMALEPVYREAVLLVHSQGLTYAEAAQVLQLPVGTVKWRVFEALKRIQRAAQAVEEKCDGVQQDSPAGDYRASHG